MLSQTAHREALSGHCHMYQALDIGFSVDLRHCASLIGEAREAGDFHHDTRTPPGLHLHPLPIHIRQAMQPVEGSTFRTEDTVTITIYDFGAVSVEYRIPFQGTLDELAAISSELYDSKQFAVDARGRADALLKAIEPAVKRPKVREAAEDYLVFVIPQLGGSRCDLTQFVAENGPIVAQILSSNTRRLSEQQQREELSSRIAYYPDDLTIITWNAALVCGGDMDDVLTVLELANVQLRELRYLDNQLDDSLQASYEIRERAGGLRARMRRIREWMLDGQAFSESVTNAFKPFPDAFLARVYTLASESLGLNRFDQSIKNKLNLLNTLYTTLSDEVDHERSLRLEWIVIILIFIEIVMGIFERF